ncbi:MAG TPA: biosynthetic-type acetolactate synthase large subunit [Spirochaetia bacterium]|nr:biosynthetic-type acetolactate synthase large subunit [Spirochaetia bacterium]
MQYESPRAAATHYSGASLLIELLKRQGIDVVAGIPGGANLPLYDALGQSGLRHVLVRHEQAGGFLAQGIARSRGGAAACFATSGPGATNLLTAVADAKLDSIPIVAVTGQVPMGLVGTDAFQEVDTYGMSIPVTKHNFLVRSAAELVEVVPEAFRIALSGRPGPVLIDLPKDVQQARIDVPSLPQPGVPDAPPEPDGALLASMARMIAASERPVLYVGGGVVASGAEEEVRALSAACGIPVVSTLMGLGIMEIEDPWYLGMIGMHGSRATNLVVDRADLLIALGVRFDDRATGSVAGFAPRARVIHLDIDEAEIGKIRRPDISAACDVRRALKRLNRLVGQAERVAWKAEVTALKREHPLDPPRDESHPGALMKRLAALAPGDALVSVDVGQHQMWAAQWWPVKRTRTFLTSGGLGTMGFSLPAAMGAAIANPDTTVVVLTGDGSMLINIQELATIAENQLDIKICVLNNGHLGLVRQQQELFYGQRYVASRFDARPDFAAIARGFGIPARSVPLPYDQALLASAFAERGPMLLDIELPETENVYPMVPPGKSNVEAISASPAMAMTAAASSNGSSSNGGAR